MEDEHSGLEYAELNRELVRRFPVFSSGYEEVRARWEGEAPGPHIVFGDLFAPHIIALLDQQEHDAELRQLFGFLELLVASKDAKVVEVAAASVIERLNDRKDWREAARLYMGPATLRVSHDMEQAWGP